MAPERDESEYWRDFLNGQRIARVSQAFMHSLPRAPRCKLCQAPFAGWGGTVVGAFGYRPIAGNGRICNWCFKSVANHPGGAEIELSALVADIRGSTGIAERMGATAFGVLLIGSTLPSVHLSTRRMASSTSTSETARSASSSGASQAMGTQRTPSKRAVLS